MRTQSISLHGFRALENNSVKKDSEYKTANTYSKRKSALKFIALHMKFLPFFGL